MKKVTVILSMLVFAVSSQAFAQNAPSPSPVKTKPAAPKPGETGYKIVIKDLVITSAQPKPAAKPKPAEKIAAKKPGTKAAYIQFDVIKASN